ncbi:vitamin B12 dependent-methionine synthase activation domain-containing protein, partial [Microbacterium sp. HSID17254]|uniref:vitamin B12 dependent-methionine synthase activation domain-containing protein n=1 Tax=Microbacterium sp. HSID17254 TaxID=2419509 RepID=UPI00237A81D4
MANEREGRGLKLPRLIGGAATSRQHTAVKIAQRYQGDVLHVLDASRVVGVVSDRLDDDRAEALSKRNDADQQRLREQHEGRQAKPLLPFADAVANREAVDFGEPPVPEFTGVRPCEPTIAELRELIDWQFLFLAWELKGKFPQILNSPVAKELYDDANAMLDQIIAEDRFTAKGVYGFWPARAEGEDIVISPDGGDVRLPLLRQQNVKPDGRAHRRLVDYLVP